MYLTHSDLDPQLPRDWPPSPWSNRQWNFRGEWSQSIWILPTPSPLPSLYRGYFVSKHNEVRGTVPNSVDPERLVR